MGHRRQGLHIFRIWAGDSMINDIKLINRQVEGPMDSNGNSGLAIMDSYKLDDPENTEKGSDRQEMVLSCLVNYPRFQMHCFLGKLDVDLDDLFSYRDINKRMEELIYALKGYIRLDMVLQGGAGKRDERDEKFFDKKFFKRWRRFWGTMKKIVENFVRWNGAKSKLNKVANSKNLTDSDKRSLKRIRSNFYGMLFPREIEIIDIIRRKNNGFDVSSLSEIHEFKSLINKKRKKAIEAQWKDFCQNKLKIDFEPGGWKSRLNYNIFENKQEAIEFIENCPLYKWKKELYGSSEEGLTECPLLSKLGNQENDGIFALIQMEDYNLLSGNVKSDKAEKYPENVNEEKLSKIMNTYLSEYNNVFTPISNTLENSCFLSSNTSIGRDSIKTNQGKSKGTHEQPKPKKIHKMRITLDIQDTKLHSGVSQEVALFSAKNENPCLYDSQDFPQFEIMDILNWNGLLVSFKVSSQIINRIKSHLNVNCRILINSFQNNLKLNKNEKKIIIEGLNELLEIKDLYDEKVFSQLKIKREWKRKLKKKKLENFSNHEIRVFNRYLLELIFKGKISKKSNKFSAQRLEKIPDEESGFKFAPYFQSDSFRGLFRSVSAFILEHLKGPKIDRDEYYTSDYLKSKNEKMKDDEIAEHLNLLDSIYGSTKRRGKFSIKFIPPATKKSENKFEIMKDGNGKCRHKFNYAWEHASNRNSNISPQKPVMHIDAVESKGSSLEIILDKPKPDEIALVLLTADAISSSYFRVGKMTSRGYGILRFTQYNYEIFPRGDSEKENKEEIKSGIDLFKKCYSGISPLEFVKNVIPNPSG